MGAAAISYLLYTLRSEAFARVCELKKSGFESRVNARALYEDADVMLEDLREAVTTLEDVVRIARRVLGGQHPLLAQIERSMQNARAKLRARESPPRGSAKGILKTILRLVPEDPKRRRRAPVASKE